MPDKVASLKKISEEVLPPPSPTQNSTYSTRLRNSGVKRNLNTSFGAALSEEDAPVRSSPRLSKRKQEKQKSKDITLVINKKSRTCHYKHISSSDEEEEEEENVILHGKRKIKPPSNLEKNYVSPIKIHRTADNQIYVTPVKNSRNRNKKEIGSAVKTPKTLKETPLKGTPKSTLKLIRDGTITPKVQSRVNLVNQQNTPLKQARFQLHVSYVPSNLPCRDKEYSDILHFLQDKLEENGGGCMYISGVPGTGKTATVTAAINFLNKCAEDGLVKEFSTVKINGMKLTEPRQAYVEIVKQLMNKTVPWEQAQNMLEQRFTKKTKKSLSPIILLVDELDIICTKRQDVIYNLLDWPSKAIQPLIVITIANTMDLPERLLMSKVTSRLGLTRLTFQPYTHKQLQEIVTKRLVGTNSFNPDAVQLVARKVASVSGDARRALDICRSAAEIAELEGEMTLVTMFHVNEALKIMVTQPKVRAIRNCSRLEQYILQAVISEVERTGIEETMFVNVFKMLVSLCALNGFAVASASVVLAAIARLSACRLLLVDQKCHDLDQRIILNVSADDVYYALKEE